MPTNLYYPGKGRPKQGVQPGRNRIVRCTTVVLDKDPDISVERGFRFLKDPWFYVESLYLKKPQRLLALIMVMTLSLLVYFVAEMKIRQEHRILLRCLGHPYEKMYFL